MHDLFLVHAAVPFPNLQQIKILGSKRFLIDQVKNGRFAGWGKRGEGVVGLSIPLLYQRQRGLCVS